jgi:hypothetical protein
VLVGQVAADLPLARLDQELGRQPGQVRVDAVGRDPTAGLGDGLGEVRLEP